MSEKKYASDYPPTMPLRERLLALADAQEKYPNSLPVLKIAQYINMFYVEDIDPENILNGRIPVTQHNFVDITKLSVEDVTELSRKYSNSNDLGFIMIMTLIGKHYATIEMGSGFNRSVFVDIDKMQAIFIGFPDMFEQMTRFKEIFGSNLISAATFGNMEAAYKRVLAEKKKIAAFKELVQQNKGTLSKDQVLEFISQFP